MIGRVTRRDFLIGGMLAAGGAGALAVRPAREPLPGRDHDISALFPDTIGQWRAAPAKDAILPPRDALSDATYDRIVARRYLSEGAPITLVAAYQAAQNWTSQLHWPEICYAASGFDIVEQARVLLLLGSAELPGGILRATRRRRHDTVFYWTRTADRLPGSLWQQRRALVEATLSGHRVDGIVMRLSLSGDSQDVDHAPLFAFTRALHASLPSEGRRLLFGPIG